MNGFERHNITHLSASSLNTWAAAPALWVMERLLGKRTPMGAAVHRGTSVERGIEAGLINPELSVDECSEIARKEYVERWKLGAGPRLLGLSSDPKWDDEAANIAPMVRLGLAELRAYGIPECQIKIERQIDDVPVPLIGYLDFGYLSHGITLDLKTTGRVPSEISEAHARQVAIYVAGTNREARVAYVSTKKVCVYRLERADDHMEAVRQIALRLERFLNLSSDPAELASLIVPDFTSWYWSNPAARAFGREVYGF